MPRVKKQSAAPPPPFWVDHWKAMHATPRAWAHQGQQLVHAFQVLLPETLRHSIDFDVRAPALMLAGMAAEVLLKAIVVNEPGMRPIVLAKRKTLSDREKLVREAFYSHDIHVLSRTAKVRLTSQQRRTAEALSQYVYWRGRYVVPRETKIMDLVPVRYEDGLVGPPNLHATIPAACELIECVVRAVKRRLYGERRPRWRLSPPD